jgi:tetratricopeptide (TPR) repeat protein
MRLDWERGNFAGARRLEEALREQGSVNRVKILLEKVCGLRKLGDRAMALEVLEELDKLDRGLAECVRGEIYLEEGDFSKGLEYFKLAGNFEGRTRHMARYREGKVEAYVGNFRRAAAIFEELQNEVALAGEVASDGVGNIREFLENILRRTHSAIDHSTFQNA